MNEFSVVVPAFNEAECLESLINEIFISLEQHSIFEVIIVNDASTDSTRDVLFNIKKKFPIKTLNHQKNLGQSKSLLDGVLISKFDTIVSIDGDGQNNPKDIDKLLNAYFSNNFSLVSGIRIARKDYIIKIFSSKIANFIRSKYLNDNCPDTGCSLKVFAKHIFLNFPFFDGIHRFLPALFNGYGFETHFMPVDHRKRLKGKSKYGTFDRLFIGIKNMFYVKKIIKKAN